MANELYDAWVSALPANRPPEVTGRIIQDIQDEIDAIDVQLPATVQGDTLYATGPDALAALAKNTTATRYLSNTGTTNNPAWAAINLANGTVLASSAAGDTLQYSAANVLARLAIGTAGQVLTVNAGATAVEWAAGGGSVSDSVERWYGPFAVVFGDLTEGADGVPESVTLTTTTLGGDWAVSDAMLIVTEAFEGAGVDTVTATVGFTGSEDAILPGPIDAETEATTQMAQSDGDPVSVLVLSETDIVIEFTPDVAAGLDELTAGALNVWLKMGQLPSGA